MFFGETALSNTILSIPHRLSFALESWREWSENIKTKPTVLGEFKEGKTNESWLLESHNKRYIARLNNPISGLLGIDRRREYVIHRAVAALGIAPPYVYLHAPSDTSIFRFIEGEPLTASEFESRQIKESLWELIAKSQSINLDMPRFNYAYQLSRYWKKVEMVKPTFAREHGQRWLEFRQQLDAFDSRSWRPVVTHHDLEASNILSSDKGLKIIDWEYAGNGHPVFDALSLGLAPEETTETLTSILHWLRLLWGLLYEYGHRR